MTTSRDFNGVLHSNERLYLDRLWQQLGVNPTDERVEAIEGRLVMATLRYVSETNRQLAIEYQRSQEKK